jgi:hypothetical protein
MPNNTRMKLAGQYYPDNNGEAELTRAAPTHRVCAETRERPLVGQRDVSAETPVSGSEGTPRAATPGREPQGEASGALRHRDAQHPSDAAQCVLQGLRAAGEGDAHVARRSKP